jgi:AcrR family transcriptional regulator
MPYDDLKAFRIRQSPKGGRKPSPGPDIEANILDAAEFVFGHFGFRGATTALIAKKAAIAKPHIYYYFEDKEDLYRAILERAMNMWARELDTLDTAGDVQTILILLNFGDFARFGKDERAMKVGNFLGLPVNFLVFSVIAVIVTAGTLKVFGQAIMDPVLIVEKIGNPIVVIIGSITFIVAMMGINIVANFVSPAYDISNLKPEKINFRMGGLITSILSVLVCPGCSSPAPRPLRCS